MNFPEFITFCELKGLISDKKFIDVSPYGVQYRYKINHESVMKGFIYYREVNGNYIMTKNALVVRGRGMLNDLPSDELINILS